jgi:uncharacterized DUF497 family protein
MELYRESVFRTCRPEPAVCSLGNSYHGSGDSALNEKQIQFEWDEIKAADNARKHGVTFEVASTVFRDPQLLTTADLAHSETEERWFSIGWASNGTILSIAYLWLESDPETTKVRLISARAATQTEIRHYAINRAYE